MRNLSGATATTIVHAGRNLLMAFARLAHSRSSATFQAGPIAAGLKTGANVGRPAWQRERASGFQIALKARAKAENVIVSQVAGWQAGRPAERVGAKRPAAGAHIFSRAPHARSSD